MTRKITLAKARAQYVHRFTMEHVPQWARADRDDGTFYAPQYRSDQEWYDRTIFPGESEMVPPRSKHCMSLDQTWPLGQSLPQPFTRKATP